MNRVVICGKGGVGKTTVTALLAESLAARRLLIVDADPVGRLGAALGVTPRGTVAEQLEIAAQQRGVDRAGLSIQAVRNILTPVPTIGDLLALGMHHHKGCFCSINQLLRLALDTVSNEFDLVLMDAEGGVEHINRQTMGEVQHLIVVAEPTVTSLQVALALADEAERQLSASTRRLVLNQTQHGQSMTKELDELLELWQDPITFLQYAPSIVERQATGESLLGMNGQIVPYMNNLAAWLRR